MINMKVVATARGFYKRLYEPGNVFEYLFDESADDAKDDEGNWNLPSWMEEAPSDKAAEPDPDADPDADPDETADPFA